MDQVCKIFESIIIFIKNLNEWIWILTNFNEFEFKDFLKTLYPYYLQHKKQLLFLDLHFFHLRYLKY